MQEALKVKLHNYIILNNPDLLITLQESGKVDSYLQDKVSGIDMLPDKLLAEDVPGYIIEERCMEELTNDLKPSKFNYLCSVFEEEFEEEYYRLKEDDTLTYEVVNLINSYQQVFDDIGFSKKSVDDWNVRYVIIGAIKEFLDNKQRERKM